MSIDKFGRYHPYSRYRGSGAGEGSPGIGITLTDYGDFNIENKRLTNVADPKDDADCVNKRSALTLDDNDSFNARNKRIIALADPMAKHDAVNLQYYLATKYNCDSNSLTNVANPKLDTDATNKKYVTDKVDVLKADITSNNTKCREATAKISSIEEKISNSCLMLNTNLKYNAKNKTIENVAPPQNLPDAANKSYVDEQINNLTQTVNNSCITLFNRKTHIYGAYNASNRRIANVATPQNNLDAVNKYYINEIIIKPINEQIRKINTRLNDLEDINKSKNINEPEVVKKDLPNVLDADVDRIL